MNALEESKLNQGSRTFDLYIGHVPKSIQEAALLEVFSKYGVVVDVLVRHVSGPFGYGIVKFKQKKDALKVLKVGKIIVDNHEMEVKSGKRSNQSVENCNGAAAVVKSVSFAEPCTNIPHTGNIHMMEAVAKDFKYSPYPNSESSSVPITVEIMCTNVENAITFHGCSLSSFEELQLVSIKLNSICPNLIRLQRKPSINKVYGALYNEDCQWYRCKVLQCAASVNSPKCIVEYIDYGNVAEISYTNMVELPEPLKNLGPFAIKCIFSNLIPSAKSQNCISYLHHLVNHRMSLCALYSWGIPEYQVTKCSCNGIDVIAELVRNGYAMHRNQVSLKALSPHVPDKASCKKTKDNQKSKKVNGIHLNKKNSDISNGIDKHSHENRDEGIQVKYGKSSSDESHLVQDFMPKKIIKRGSESVLVNHQFTEEAKTVNHFLKVDSVIANVKVINNIRGLIPLHTYDDLISQAVDLLRNEMNISISDDCKKLVENARKEYCKALANIKNCSGEDALPEFKEKRNKQRAELCNELKKFLDTFDITLLEKRKRIQETITALESNSTAWLNVYLPKIPDTIEELLAAFNEEKERKRNAIEMARRKTDEKRAAFLTIYADLGKEFSLNTVDGKTDDSYFVNTGGKKGSWALKFDEALTEFGIALEEERKISTVIEDRSYISVIQYILQKLDIPKDKIDAECEVYEEYKSLYDDLMKKSDLKPVFNELHSLSKTINSFTSSDDENAEKLSDEHIELHSALLYEDTLLVDLVKASSQHFPELVREHPELHLEEYQKHLCLLKLNWKACFFPHLEKCNRIVPSYISKLCLEPIVIKEFQIDPESEMFFLKKVKVWNEIKSNDLVKVRGLFKGEGENIIYAVMTPVWETLYDNPLAVPVDYKAALNILQQVLEGLCDIHSRGIIHGAVHPMSILVNGDKVLLDLNPDKQHLQDKLSIKGINFQVPNNEGDPIRSSDMYSFGCLVLWVLFPNLSFHSTDKGVPDINAFQSIILTMLGSKDFSALTALLNANKDIRPSSRHLRSSRFLKNLNIISDASSPT